MIAIDINRIPDSIGKDIEKKCQCIYPLHDVYIRKVKVLKKPKFDGKSLERHGVLYMECFALAVGKLMDMHGEGAGAKVDGSFEPAVQTSV